MLVCMGLAGALSFIAVLLLFSANVGGAIVAGIAAVVLWMVVNSLGKAADAGMPPQVLQRRCSNCNDRW